MNEYEINTDKGKQTVKAKNKQAAIASLEGSGFTYAPRTSINSDSFKDEAAITVTQPVPATQGDGLSAVLTSQADTFLSDLSKRTEETRQNKSTALKTLLQNTLSQEGEAGATSRLYEETGVNEADSGLKDINAQIIAEDRALEKRLRALKENPQGLFGGALDQEIQRVKDESLARQADMAVVQLARQGKYDSARAIADRAVAALVEREKNVNQALRLTYEDFKDEFTTVERREFETAQAEREREADNKEYRLRAIFNQRIDQENAAYKASVDGSGGGGVALAPEDRRILTGAGFSAGDIVNIAKDVNEHGIDAVLEGITNPAQQAAIKKVYSVQDVLTRDKIAAQVTLKAAQDGLKGTYTEAELQDLAREKGFKRFFKSKVGETEEFLNSDVAKELYTDLLYEQYKAAGMAE